MPIILFDDAVVNEGAGFAILTFRLDQPSATPVSLDWGTQQGSALSGSDFTGASGTVTFAAGETVKTVQVAITNDATLEGNELFTVALSNIVGASVERGFAIVTIAANDRGDRAPIASVADVAVDEGDGVARFVVTLDRAAAVPVVVSYATVNGTAVAGSDYAANAGSVTFAAGETVKIIEVALTNDALAEAAESFRLTLTGISGVTGAALGDAVAEARIGLSDTPPLATPTLSVEDMVFSEGEANGLMQVTFRLSSPSAVETAVDWTTQQGTALSGSDYRGSGDRLVFAAGETVKTISIPVIDNATIEGVEHFFLNFASTGLNLERNFATVSIVDNDSGTRAPIASVADTVVDEDDGAAYVTITLDQAASQSVTVSYATSAVSAAAGSDFTTLTDSVTFNPGETAKTIRIDIANDTVAEAIETFDFSLTGITGVTGAAIGDGQARVQIGASDGATLATPTVSIDDMVFGEGETSGTMLLVFRLSAPSASATSVSWNTQQVTALSGSDYTGLNGTLFFEPGETIKAVRMPVLDNGTAEGTEQFRVNLTGATGLRIDKGFATISIVDNDRGERAPVASVGDATVDETDGFAHFAITLDRAASVPVTVAYTTVNGNAGVADFGTQTGSVTFNPGETARTVSIAITNDGTSEGAESFSLRLTGISGVTNATIGDGLGSGTIALSDRPTVATPDLTVDSVTDMEGGDGVMTFVFRLSAPSNAATSVTFTTSQGTALSGSDYVSQTDTLTFAPGETVKTVQFAVIDDSNVEANESFTLNLGSPVGLNLPAGAVTGTIRDNDAARVSVATTQVRVNEGSGAGTTTATVFIYREGDTSTAQSVNWAVTTSTATTVNGTDFVGGVLPSGSVTFAAGETAKAVTVQIARDSTVEADEAFKVTLTAPTAGLRLDNASTDLFIVNDDAAPPPPQFSVAVLSAERAEGNSGATPFTFTVTRSGDTSGTGSVAWSVSGSGANPAAAADFATGVLPSGTVSFAAGEVSKIITLDVQGDTLAEANEGFGITLSAPVGGTLGTATASGTIQNDDSGTITGTNSANTLTGTEGNDTILGLGGNDTISGLGGNDSIDGGGGADRITGGTGADILIGGAQADTFIFTALTDSTPALAGRDRIADFSASQGDRINLVALDADSALAGDQAFVLVPEDFTGTPGQISIATWGSTHLVQADVNGDGVSDFSVTVISTAALTQADFLL